MRLMPQGDYYVWYCEWCDTRNLTLWIKIESNQLCCAACQKKFPAFEENRSVITSGIAAGFRLLP